VDGRAFGPNQHTSVAILVTAMGFYIVDVLQLVVLGISACVGKRVECTEALRSWAWWKGSHRSQSAYPPHCQD